MFYERVICNKINLLKIVSEKFEKIIIFKGLNKKFMSQLRVQNKLQIVTICSENNSTSHT